MNLGGAKVGTRRSTVWFIFGSPLSSPRQVQLQGLAEIESQLRA